MQPPSFKLLFHDGRDAGHHNMGRDIFRDDSAAGHKGMGADFDMRNDGRANAEEGAMANDRSAAQLAARRNRGIILEDAVMRDIGEAVDVDVIAQRQVAVDHGLRTDDAADTHLHVRSDVCRGMNDIDESAALLGNHLRVFLAPARRTHGTDEDVVGSRRVGLGRAEDRRIIGEAVERVGLIVQEALHDKARVPRIVARLASEGTSADDDELLFRGHEGSISY